MVYVFSTIFVIGLAGFIREALHWRTPEGARLTGAQKARRILISACILVICGMGIRGAYFPPVERMSEFQKAEALLYWGVCLLLLVVMLAAGYIEAKTTYFMAMKAEKELISDHLGGSFVFSKGDHQDPDDK